MSKSNSSSQPHGESSASNHAGDDPLTSTKVRKILLKKSLLTILLTKGRKNPMRNVARRGPAMRRGETAARWRAWSW